MVRRLTAQLIQDYPEYVELYGLLSLAAETWPRFGVSAGDLAEMDDLTLAMVRLIMERGPGE